MAARAQQLAPRVHPQPRVVRRVDDAARTLLPHTRPASVASATVGRRLDPSTALHGMVLVLQPSAEQQVALRAELEAQQDSTSASFHRWLTPETFAQSYGVSTHDIAAVTGWLQGSGLAVQSVSRSARFITFSGSAGAVETTFHTELHHLSRHGELHVANTTDISVPAALAPVVRGLARLDDLYRHDAVLQGAPVLLPQTAAGHLRAAIDPLAGTSAAGTHYVAPGDAAVIYNALPLTRAGIDGHGTTIVVLGRSNVLPSTVASFRSLFGLPANPLSITVAGTDPGVSDDAAEAYLDTEWAGSLATGSTVQLVVSGATLTGAGVDTASLYAVDNNVGDILTLSYGECESDATASGTAFWNDLWQQAAAQGQTVFVSSGDSGAAGCNAATDTFADAGYGVNALGSSAYNVAVGGTMFVDYGPAQFWGAASASPFTSALGYIPEAAWNQGRIGNTDLNPASTGTVADTGIYGGGGGVSIDTARPSWQTGSLIPDFDPVGSASGSTITGLHRLVPDVSMMASFGHDGSLFCGSGMCTGAGALVNVGVVGGTSLSAPLMASAQALINAKNGGRQGNVNYVYYALAARQHIAGLTCQATTGTAAQPSVRPPDSTCDFHDVVTGSILVPTNTLGTLSLGFSAIGGFDEATGLGSVNIANLANDWGTFNYRSSEATLTLSPATGVTHGTAQAFAVTVSPGGGTGTPTGAVTLVASDGLVVSPEPYALTAGSITGSLATLPAGDYAVHAHYAGDTVFAASDSAPVAVSIAREPSSLTLTPQRVDVNGRPAATSTFTYGDGLIDLAVTATAHSGNGTPTGNVVFNVQGPGSMPALTVALAADGTASLLAGPGVTGLPQNYPTLPAGNYAIAAGYAGDTSFLAADASVAFTVARATITPQLLTTAPSFTLQPGAAVTLQFSIATPAGAAAASGNVHFLDTTTATTLCTVTLANGSATCTTSALAAAGAHTLIATYAGDSNYAPASASPLVFTVAGPVVPVLSLAATPATLFTGSVSTLTATLQPAAASTMRFYDNGVLLGTVASPASTGIAQLSWTGFTAGAHT